jgi:hypothetical protein
VRSSGCSKLMTSRTDAPPPVRGRKIWSTSLLAGRTRRSVTASRSPAAPRLRPSRRERLPRFRGAPWARPDFPDSGREPNGQSVSPPQPTHFGGSLTEISRIEPVAELADAAPPSEQLDHQLGPSDGRRLQLSLGPAAVRSTERLRSWSRSPAAPSRNRHLWQCAHDERFRGDTQRRHQRRDRSPLQIHSGMIAFPRATSAATTRSRPQPPARRPCRPHTLGLSPARLHSPASRDRRTPDSGRSRPDRAANRLRGWPIPAAAVYRPHAPRWIQSCADAWRESRGTARAHRTARGGSSGPFACTEIGRPTAPETSMAGAAVRDEHERQLAPREQAVWLSPPRQSPNTVAFRSAQPCWSPGLPPS